MEQKPEISEQEAEAKIKGMGRVATGIVRATAISANPEDSRIQNEVSELLEQIQRQNRIVKKPRTAQWR